MSGSLVSVSNLLILGASLVAGSGGKESACLQCRRPRFDPWIGKSPWRKEWLPIPVFLPGEFHGQRILVGYSPWDHKQSNTTERQTLLLIVEAGLHPLWTVVFFFFFSRTGSLWKDLCDWVDQCLFPRLAPTPTHPGDRQALWDVSKANLPSGAHGILAAKRKHSAIQWLD